MNNDKCRAEFEKYFNENPNISEVIRTCHHDDDYVHGVFFDVWRAAWEAAKKDFKGNTDSLTPEQLKLREDRIKRALSCMPKIS